MSCDGARRMVCMTCAAIDGHTCKHLICEWVMNGVYCRAKALSETMRTCLRAGKSMRRLWINRAYVMLARKVYAGAS